MAGRAVTASVDPPSSTGGRRERARGLDGPRLRSRQTQPAPTAPRARRPARPPLSPPARPDLPRPGREKGLGGGEMDGSAPPTHARPRLTQRPAMRALLHPRQNNSDLQSLPSPAELCACKWPPWATKISVESLRGRQGSGQLGNSTGGWNSRPGGRRAWQSSCACLTVASQPALKPSSRREQEGYRKMLSICRPSRGPCLFGGRKRGGSRGRSSTFLPSPVPGSWPDPPRAQSEKYVPRAIKLSIEPF